MQDTRSLVNALIAALISITLTIGALSISFVQSAPEKIEVATATLPPSPIPITATASPLPTLTPTIAIESPTPSATLTSTITSAPSIVCPPPPGWVTQIVAIPGDTLESIAAKYRIAKDQLRAGNCLVSDTLVPYTKLYVPPFPTNTVAACIPGAANWSRTYVIKSGDTLYSLASAYYTDVATLKRINCKFTDHIVAGEMLWVPAGVTPKTAIPAPVFTNTPIPTNTQWIFPYTATDIPLNLPFTATNLPPLPFTSTPPTP